MSLPRKVFVASKLTQDVINKTFKWPAGFERTLDRDEAEFIIFDVQNFPEKWINYLGDKPAFYVPSLNLPVLFVALGEVAPEFDYVKKHFNPIELPVYKSPEELFNAMQWLQSIFPFYNETKSRKFDKETAHAVLVLKKALSGRGASEDIFS